MTSTIPTTPLGPAAELPEPGPDHATCAWCRMTHGTIVELLDHVARAHAELDDAA
ncbi:MAG: hypothetical protein AB7L84_10360 [Acidimicrobiia bacterium]